MSEVLHAREGTEEACAPRVIGLLDEYVAHAHVAREIATSTADAACQRHRDDRVRHGLAGTGKPGRQSRRGRNTWRAHAVEFGPGGEAGRELPDLPSDPAAEWLRPLTPGEDSDWPF